jgi:hypothetical protein
MIFRHSNPNFRKRHPGKGVLLDTSFCEFEEEDAELELALAFIIGCGTTLEYWHCNNPLLGEGEWIPIPEGIRTPLQLRCFIEDPWHPL